MKILIPLLLFFLIPLLLFFLVSIVFQGAFYLTTTNEEVINTAIALETS